MIPSSDRTTPDRLLKLSEVLEMVQVSRSTLYLMMNNGRFPRPVRVHLRCVRWRESELVQWMASRQKASRADWT